MLVVFGTVSNSSKAIRSSALRKILLRSSSTQSSSIKTGAGAVGAQVPAKPRTRPFSSQVQSVISSSQHEFVNAALNFNLFENDHTDQNANITSSIPANIAQELTLAEVASLSEKDRADCDKIIVLLRHGEAWHNTFQQELADAEGSEIPAGLHPDCPRDPLLTGKGCGQALNISRSMDVYCNNSTKFVPDLIVVSPLRRATQTAMIGFSRFHPMKSFRGIPWVCNPLVAESTRHLSDIMAPPNELALEFPGIDYSSYKETYEPIEEQNLIESQTSVEENEIDLAHRAGAFLQWIKERDEKVIFVATHSLWLDAFSTCALNCPLSLTEPYSHGEMRTVALKWL